ncbi:MAG TPA: NFACT RNA binding domain-containing protein, partial [Chloroflexota bacterium]|nr:NFACT RNA binding domain-containing protein [Chloroflexota bacterium]
WMLLSAHPERARVHLSATRPQRTSDRVTPLLLLLRKYVDGARLDAVEQPSFERVIRLRFSKRAPGGEVWRTDLVAEVMGRLSNLILVDEDGVVMDSIKRVPASMNRVRTVLPRQRYDGPPPQDKLSPVTANGDTLAAAVEHESPAKPAAAALVSHVNACSPLLAREVVFRVHGRIDVRSEDADWPALALALSALWEAAVRDSHAPCVVVQPDGRLAAYAAYPLLSHPNVQPVASLSTAVEQWFAERASGPKPQADAARRLSFRKGLLEAQDRLRGKLYSLRQSLVDESEVVTLRERGRRQLAEGAVDEAQDTFAHYDKVKAALRDVPAMVEGVENELRYLDEALILLDLATTPGDLNELRAEWAEQGYLSATSAPRRQKKQASGKWGKGSRDGHGSRKIDQGPPTTGYRRVAMDGFEVLVGRSGKGNDALLGHEARPADTWLHARGVPGAHVVIRTGGRELPDSVLLRAAALAAGYSQARAAPRVGVDYTLCKHVHRIKGGPPGLATYHSERTLSVVPAALDL